MRKPNKPIKITEKSKNLDELFDGWFLSLLHDQPSCLDRDVLREPSVKVELRKSFHKWYGLGGEDNA